MQPWWVKETYFENTEKSYKHQKFKMVQLQNVY